MIDWTNPTDKVSRFFTVREAIGLPRWGRLATEADGLDLNAKSGLVEVFDRMDEVRLILGVPIRVHCALRPKRYNDEVGGAPESAHMARKIVIQGQEYFIGAADWDPLYPGLSVIDACRKAREVLIPRLEELGLRMEDNGPEGDWIHCDNKPVFVGGHRLFRL